MPKTIRVVKPFVFSYPLESDKKIHREKHLAAGEQEIDDEMAAHPWIEKHFADGCIETPAAALARTQAAKVAADKATEDNQRILAEAQAAFDRAVTQSRAVMTPSDVALHKALNTPINELGTQQGAGIVESVPNAPAAAPAADPAKDAGGKKTGK